MFNLTNKKALVTGGSRGIGRGIALSLAKQGADVAVNYRSNEAEAQAVVSASKGGMVALTENMALDLAPKGINVNAVAPGVIETDMTRGLLGDEKTKSALLARIPKNRLGKPEDIGAAVAFLASDEADYITGTVLYVDGGWLAA